MKNTYIYPAIFEKEDYGYTVYFPDLEGCFTEGENISNAFEEAKEAMLAFIGNTNENELPKPTDPSQINVAKAGDFVSLVELDIIQYRQKHNNVAVKKTLTIPAWLNNMALEKHINFSATLQEALKIKLGV